MVFTILVSLAASIGLTIISLKYFPHLKRTSKKDEKEIFPDREKLEANPNKNLIE
tara:strand:+ start:141 stop:305 length:165 start_codon:yes stop_codon:yes gene_type:complete